MPWKYSGRILKPGKAWTDNNGNQHPGVWMRYSSSQKSTFGIVWEDPPASEAAFDNRFYSGRQVDGTLIPKSLTDTLWVDADGNAVNDPLTGQQGKTLGLKNAAIAQVKTQAASLLAAHDWQVVKATEVESYSVPSTVTTYRAAVRTASNNIETAITNASDLDAFIALFNDTRNSDGVVTAVAKINDWPDGI